jgi:hypothetical protein
LIGFAVNSGENETVLIVHFLSEIGVSSLREDRVLIGVAVLG